mgnify:CR=1 FL=1
MGISHSSNKKKNPCGKQNSKKQTSKKQQNADDNNTPQDNFFKDNFTEVKNNPKRGSGQSTGSSNYKTELNA